MLPKVTFLGLKDMKLSHTTWGNKTNNQKTKNKIKKTSHHQKKKSPEKNKQYPNLWTLLFVIAEVG